MRYNICNEKFYSRVNRHYKRIILALTNRTRRLCQLRNRFNFLMFESLSLSGLTLGNKIVFHNPVHVRGGSGLLQIQDNVNLGFPAGTRMGSGSILLQPRRPDAIISIGQNTSFNNNVSFIAQRKIIIGNNCLIGDMVAILDADGHEFSAANRGRSAGKAEPVILGNNVWLGSRVVILKGVEIGANSVIGAMSVVTRSIPENSIAAGNPARVIRTI